MIDLRDLVALDLPTSRESISATVSQVPLVAHSSAIHDPAPPASAVRDLIQIPIDLLAQLRTRSTPSRRGWARFLAVRVSGQQAAGMQPLLPPQAVAVIDRHYNSPVPYAPPTPSVFAMRVGNGMLFRIPQFESNRLVLRPLEIEAPLQLLTLGPYEAPADLVVGRLCLVVGPVA
jgi:hypothetical protein